MVKIYTLVSGCQNIEYNSTRLRAILLWAQPVTGLAPGIMPVPDAHIV